MELSPAITLWRDMQLRMATLTAAWRGLPYLAPGALFTGSMTPGVSCGWWQLLAGPTCLVVP